MSDSTKQLLDFKNSTLKFFAYGQFFEEFPFFLRGFQELLLLFPADTESKMREVPESLTLQIFWGFG